MVSTAETVYAIHGNRMEATPESQLQQPHGTRVGPSLTSAALLSAALALLAGLALRAWMLLRLFEVDGDSLIYGGIAKNLLLHGRYALTLGNGDTYLTLIRLPGYPFFLALCFRLFGIENYFAACCVQIGLDLAGCLLLAGFVARVLSSSPPPIARRAALAALWLAALCPFIASYDALPMAEAPTFFALCLALWTMAHFRQRPGWLSGLGFTCAVTWAALLRPDGALAAIAFVPVVLMAFRDSARQPEHLRRLTRIAVVCLLLALAPFAAWTWRNWSVYHIFQPLAPRLATDPGEDPNPGWESWVKSWCLDFASTYQIYWNVPDGKLDIRDLPSRAFDSPQQYAATAALADDYNLSQRLTPPLNARFAALARQRIAAHPLRYYLVLPLGRLADMWLRPRVENLPIDLDWWNYARHHNETLFSWLYAALNLLYLLLAGIGLLLRPRYWQALLAYLLLRSALLLTVEAPETRYTLECFPMLFALGAVALAAALRSLQQPSPRPGAGR